MSQPVILKFDNLSGTILKNHCEIKLMTPSVSVPNLIDILTACKLSETEYVCVFRELHGLYKVIWFGMPCPCAGPKMIWAS